MIYLLLDLCSRSSFLRLLYFIKVIIRVICIAVPILLVVMLMIDLSKAMVKDDKDLIIEVKNKTLKRTLAAIIVFLVPSFVSLLLNVLDFSGYNDCIKDLSIESIKLAKSKEQEIKSSKDKEQKEEEASNRSDYEQYVNDHKEDNTSKENNVTANEENSNNTDIGNNIGNNNNGEKSNSNVENGNTGEKSNSSDGDVTYTPMSYNKNGKIDENSKDSTMSYVGASSDNSEILHEALSDFLRSKNSSVEKFDEVLMKKIGNAGYKTRNGVTTAAYTLISELGKYNKKIPYYWGGGHGNPPDFLSNGNYGSDSACPDKYANDQVYKYCGLDCSGFVTWALYNGGYNVAQRGAGSFQYLNGAKRVTLSSTTAVLRPGDILESDSHVALVIGVDTKNKLYTCAEAKGNAYGVLFTTRSFAPSGYWGVDMTDYYSKTSNMRTDITIKGGEKSPSL